MPANPNAGRDKTLEAILKTLNRTNDLLLAQTKVLEKMEQHARPARIVMDSPYLERSGGEDGTVTAGDNPTSPGTGLG